MQYQGTKQKSIPLAWAEDVHILSAKQNAVSIYFQFILASGKFRKRNINGDGNGKETEAETVKKRWTQERNGK